MKNRHTQIEQLEHLLAQTQNAKILWEEMQIALKQAFDLQDTIMEALDTAEKKEKDVDALTQIFDEREHVWDVMGQIAARALEVRETRLKKAETGTAHQCCCGGHGHKHDGCCDTHKQGEACCGHHHCGCDAPEKAPKKRCCKKKKEA